MSYTSHVYQRLALLAKIDPASMTAGTYTTDVINLAVSPFRRVFAAVHSGTLGSGGTVDFKFQYCNTSGGSYVDIDGTNCAIPQIVASNKVETLEFPAESVNNLGIGYTFFKGLLTIGTATSVASVDVYGFDCRYNPASAYNLAAVLNNTVYLRS